MYFKYVNKNKKKKIKKKEKLMKYLKIFTLKILILNICC